MTSLDYIAIAAVLIIGVPHGGLDGAVARRVGWTPNLVGWLTFHLAYIAIAAIVTAIWWWFPTVSLGLFLVISARIELLSSNLGVSQTCRHLVL